MNWGHSTGPTGSHGGVRTADGPTDAVGGPAPETRIGHSSSEPVTTLTRYVERTFDPTNPDERTGATVRLTVDQAFYERTRTALRRLAADADERTVMLAATALEVAFEDLGSTFAEPGRSITVEFDASDCAVMALAQLRLSRFEGADRYRERGCELYEKLQRAVPAFDPDSRR